MSAPSSPSSEPWWRRPLTRRQKLGFVGGALVLLLIWVVNAALSGVIGTIASYGLPIVGEHLGRQVRVKLWYFVVGVPAAIGVGALGMWMLVRHPTGSSLPNPSSDSPTSILQANVSGTTTVIDAIVDDLAVRGSSTLSEAVRRLRVEFERLGRTEDAAWCRAEIKGYEPESTPKYRIVDCRYWWTSPSGVATINVRTGHSSGPQDRVEQCPVTLGVSELVRLASMPNLSYERPTGRVTDDGLHAYREQVEIKPDAIRQVLRGIADEATQRALAASTTNNQSSPSQS